MTSRMGRLRLPSLCSRHRPQGVRRQAGGGRSFRRRSTAAPTSCSSGRRTCRRQSCSRSACECARSRSNRSLLLINDRLDIVQACGADGAQLPENGLPTPVARWVLGRHALLGRSVHSVEAAQQAEADGADMVSVGPVFETPSKPKAHPVGTALIKEIAESVPLPVIAIGGVTPENAGEVIRAGAAGVAVISAICGADDPRAAAEALTQAMGEAWNRDRLMAERQRRSVVIAVTVNGKQREIEAEIDLAGFLQELEIDPRTVAVACNGEVVPRDRYPDRPCAKATRLEIVRMVGGG